LSRFSYGNISMGFPKTENLSYTPEFADDGSYLWTRVDLTVSGLINPYGMSYGGDPPNAARGFSAGQTVETIRSVLLQPRQPLLFDFGSEEMISTPAPGFPCDVNNGPVPGLFSLTRMDGVQTIACRFSVSTWIIECPGKLTPLALINNSYAQSHSVNEQQLCIIATTGRAVFRTDILENAHDLADDYRELLNIPTPLGFRRTRADLQITPSRNALTYSFLDVEQMYDLGETDPGRDNGAAGLTGSGILSADIDKTVSSTGAADGVVSYMTMNSLSINLVGSKAASNWRMTQVAFSIAASLLPIGNLKSGYIKQISVRQRATDRVVGLHVDMMLFPVDKAKDPGKLPGLATDFLRADQVLPDQGGQNPSFLTRGGTAGSYSNELKASAWKSICQQPPGSKEGKYDPNKVAGTSSDNTGPVVTVTTTDVLPDIPSDYSISTATQAYTLYEVHTTYQIHQSTVMCPIAARTAPPTYTSTSQTPQYDPSPYDGEDDPKILYGPQGKLPESRPAGPDAEFLTLARPTTRVVVDVSAARVGIMPALPGINQDPNLVLLEYLPAFKAPELLPDGFNYMFYSSCRMIFGMKRSKQLGEPLNFGAAPYTTLAATDNFYPAEAFVDGIADGLPTDPDNLGNTGGQAGLPGRAI